MYVTKEDEKDEATNPSDLVDILQNKQNKKEQDQDLDLTNTFTSLTKRE